MPSFTPEPLRVRCNSCGTEAETWDYQHPDLAVVCGCCPVVHDHTGLGCRPVTITATAHLTLFDIAELMDMAAERGALHDPSDAVRNAEVVPLWHVSIRRTPAG